jgi:hypothetical protein
MERHNLDADRPKSRKSIWLVALASVVWLSLVTALLVTRRSEWWPIFEARQTAERLALSEVGGFLTAIFVPLVFLWLIVVALVQRQELEAARQAFATQQKELEKTTDLMSQTLDATRVTITYQEFSLRLYFLATYVIKEAAKVSVTVQPGMTIALFRRPPQFELTDQQPSVDALLGLLENWLRHGVQAVIDGVARIDTIDKQRTAAFLDTVSRMKIDIADLLDRYSDNLLVAARVEGTNLREIHRLLQAVEATWEMKSPG